MDLLNSAILALKNELNTKHQVGNAEFLRAFNYGPNRFKCSKETREDVISEIILNFFMYKNAIGRAVASTQDTTEFLSLIATISYRRTCSYFSKNMKNASDDLVRAALYAPKSELNSLEVAEAIQFIESVYQRDAKSIIENPEIAKLGDANMSLEFNVELKKHNSRVSSNKYNAKQRLVKKMGEMISEIFNEETQNEAT